MENKKTRIKLILALFVGAMIVFSAGSYTNVVAQDNIEKKVSIVPKYGDENAGIFNDSDGFWYPGRKLTKEFVVKNKDADEIEFDKISVKIQSVNSFILNRFLNSDEDIYKEFLKYLKVQLKDKDTVLFDGTFEDFNNKGVDLKNPIIIPSNGQKELSLTLYFLEPAGNIFQNLQHKFNLSIVYTLKDGAKVTSKITDLPKTGGMANLFTLTVLGMAFIGAGLIISDFLGIKRKKASLVKGGNRIE
jgi:LPXTG-motif cell wall-anchored protein